MGPLARSTLSRLAGGALAARPTRRQKRIALAVAAVADIVQIGLAPLFGEGLLSPLDDALDIVVALALVMTLGFRWRTVIALAIELIPGVALFPSWTALIATMPTAPEPVQLNPAELADVSIDEPPRLRAANDKIDRE
jgi:hypothetical protein